MPARLKEGLAHNPPLTHHPPPHHHLDIEDNRNRAWPREDEAHGCVEPEMEMEWGVGPGGDGVGERMRI